MSDTPQDKYRISIRGQEIPVIVGILTILATLSVFYFQRQVRSVSYQYSTNKVFEASLPDVQLTYKNVIADKLYITDIKISNTGNQTIKSSEIIEGISIDFGKFCRILEANIIESNPEEAISGFSENILSDSFSAKFKPSLMNPKDSATIRFITKDCQPNVQISARIEGIKDISGKPDNRHDVLKILMISIPLFTILLVIIFGQDKNRSDKRNKISKLREQIHHIEKHNLFDSPEERQKIDQHKKQIKNYQENLRETRSFKENTSLIVIIFLLLFSAISAIIL